MLFEKIKNENVRQRKSGDYELGAHYQTPWASTYLQQNKMSKNKDDKTHDFY